MLALLPRKRQAHACPCSQPATRHFTIMQVCAVFVRTPPGDGHGSAGRQGPADPRKQPFGRVSVGEASFKQTGKTVVITGGSQVRGRARRQGTAHQGREPDGGASQEGCSAPLAAPPPAAPPPCPHLPPPPRGFRRALAAPRPSCLQRRGTTWWWRPATSAGWTMWPRTAQRRPDGATPAWPSPATSPTQTGGGEGEHASARAGGQVLAGPACAHDSHMH